MQDSIFYFGTLRTDLRLAGVDFFPDFDGADFIGADAPFVFFVPDRALLFDFDALVLDCVFGAVNAARARWAAALVPANTISMAGVPCFFGSA